MAKARPQRKLRVGSHSELDGLLAERREWIRRGYYAVLGTVSLLETERGVMRFPHDTGPTVGYFVDPENENAPINRLVVMSPWEGLPDLREGSDKPCQACLLECDVCDPTGHKLCEALKCGGSGTRTDNGKPCDACEGTGRMVCPVCRGTRKAPSGRTPDGSKRCTDCGGTKFQGKNVPQDLEQFINAKLGTMTVLGPITAMVLLSVSGESGRIVRIFDVERDDAGDYIVLLLEPTSTVTRSYLLGGVLKERRR